MSFKPIECPVCHTLLRSKFEKRTERGDIKRWSWLRWCPVCGTPLKVVFGEPFNRVEGVEVDHDR